MPGIPENIFESLLQFGTGGFYRGQTGSIFSIEFLPEMVECRGPRFGEPLRPSHAVPGFNGIAQTRECSTQSSRFDFGHKSR